MPSARATSRRAALACILAGSAGLACPALAADRRPIHVVVPAAAETRLDLVGRALADSFSLVHPQPAHVENHSGDQGLKGIMAVRHAPPDGRTLLLAGSSFVSACHLPGYVPYDPQRQFAPIAQLTHEPLVLVVAAQGEARTLPAVIEAAAADPAGQTSLLAFTDPLSRLIAETMGRLCGLPLKTVGYESATELLYDLEAGTVLAAWIRPAQLPRRSRALRPIAVSSASRSTIFPEVPSAQEAGVEGLDIGCWTGLFGPAELPAETRERIFRGLEAAFGDWGLRARLAALGMEPGLMPGREMLATMRQHDRAWAATKEGGTMDGKRTGALPAPWPMPA